MKAKIGYNDDRKLILIQTTKAIKKYINNGFTRDQAVKLAEEEIAANNLHNLNINYNRFKYDWEIDAAQILRDQKNTDEYRRIFKEDYSFTYDQLENLDTVRSLYKGSDINLIKLSQIIKKVMKLKKGSAAAKSFMAKLRAAKKKAVKKAKVVKTKAKKVHSTLMSGDTHTDTKSHNYRINISGNENKATYDIHFNDEYNSNNKGFKESLAFCKKYIKIFNGTKESYFADYKNGYVQIVNNQTGNVVYSTKVK